MDNSWQFVLNLVVYLVYFDDVILAAAEADFLGVFFGGCQSRIYYCFLHK